METIYFVRNNLFYIHILYELRKILTTIHIFAIIFTLIIFVLHTILINKII